MKKIFVLVLFSFISAFAQSAGNSGLSFLKNGFGARNIALSDFGVVGSSDLTALNYNPALLSNYTSPQLMLSHSQSIQDMATSLLGASFSLWNVPFAIGINSTSIKDIEIRTKPGEPESTFSANYLFGSLSTGFEVYKKLSVGITTKYIYENLYSDESGGWAFDFGLSYSNIIEGLDFGMSLKNIGSLSELRVVETELPKDFRIGFAYGFILNSLPIENNIIGGVQKYLDTDDLHFHVGDEIVYDEFLAVRLGFMTGYDAKGFTAGLGLYWKGINFDYAFTPYSFGLGNAHTISLMYTFN